MGEKGMSIKGWLLAAVIVGFSALFCGCPEGNLLSELETGGKDTASDAGDEEDPPPGIPDIGITRDGGTLVANGGGPIDFGTVYLYELPHSSERTFTIHNDGDGSLGSISVAVNPSGGTPAGTWAMTPPPLEAIDPENTTDFIIKLGLNDAYQTGTFSASVVVSSDDPDTPSYSFSVTGSVAGYVSWC